MLGVFIKREGYTCSVCHGKGWIEKSDESRMECPTCGGSGRLHEPKHPVTGEVIDSFEFTKDEPSHG